VAHSSPLLPDLAAAGRLYTRLLWSTFGAYLPEDQYLRVADAFKALATTDDSLAACRTRGTVSSHRDWMMADLARLRLRQQWRELFREWDAVLCPPMPTVAFRHDHTPEQIDRRIDIDGKLYPTWTKSSGLAWPPSPGYPQPRHRLGFLARVSRSGCKSSVPISKIGRLYGSPR
jgi:amidase